jgi:hypothetical protein
LDRSKGAVWVAVEKLGSGERLVVFSTHFWWKSESESDDFVRLANARDLWRELSMVAARHGATIVGGGDFNAEESSLAVSELGRRGLLSARIMAPLADRRGTCREAPVRDNRGRWRGKPVEKSKASQCIDHILHLAYGIRPVRFALDCSAQALDVSDHSPAIFDFALETGIVRLSSARGGKDMTGEIQAALDSGARTIVFKATGFDYVTGPLFVRSDTGVVFEEGVRLVARKGAFADLFNSLVTVHGATNVSLRALGSGAVLKMNIRDYQSDAYRRGEWRHAVNLLSAANVTISNLTMADSGGDGIYVGAKPSTHPCRNIAIRDCVCDNNNRQGISVISADGLAIERTVMKNTCGTAPRSGIDFEPNSAGQVLKNIVMRDCVTVNNAGAGYEFYASSLGSGSEPVDITLENCRSIGDRSASLKVWSRHKGANGMVRGRFTARKCRFSECPASAVTVIDKPQSAFGLVLDDCTIERKSNLPPAVADVKFVNSERSRPPTDKVAMRNLSIYRDNFDGWFSVTEMPWSQEAMEKVVGSVTLVAPGGKRQLALDRAWREAVFPRSAGKFPLDKVEFDASKVIRVVDSAAGRSVPLSPMTIRFSLSAIAYAAAPGKVAFSAKAVRVGRSALKDAKFTVKDMAGKTVAVLPAVGDDIEERSFFAPCAGFYRIVCDMRPHGIRLVSCDVPLAVEPAEKFGFDIYKSECEFYFARAAGADEAFFCGGVAGEASTIVLEDPLGAKTEWRNRMDWGAKRLGPECAQGIWSVRIAKPDDGYVWEDACFDRTGTPALFFLGKEKYWVMGK